MKIPHIQYGDAFVPNFDDSKLRLMRWVKYGATILIGAKFSRKLIILI